ncbi:MAG: hypothetical protein J6H31_06680 [Butyrivibrio sp.]|nr:hypothetical protein [Butyrivibrio sp.]
MNLTNLNKAKTFFDSFKCEHISKENIDNIKDNFYPPKYGENLTEYVKSYALNDDNDNEEKVYIVKSKDDDIVFYFSLKCGLLYKPEKSSLLDEEKEELAKMIFEAIEKDDKNLLSEYKKSDELKNCWDEIYTSAYNRWKALQETTADNGRSMSVYKVHPAIELSRFCKNNTSHHGPFGIPIGFGIFWRKIVPIILDVSKSIGCKFVYLFAANKKESINTNDNPRDLIAYYRDSLNFRDAQELVMIKSEYDWNCHPMLQRVTDLQATQNSIWEKFEDAINED